MPTDPNTPRSKREAYYREFGPAMAKESEFDVMMGLVFAALGISQDEFLDRVRAHLETRDELLRLKAGGN